MGDRQHMRRALELARTAEGRVSPRPPVGAVVLDPSGRVVGEGVSDASPGPHAEVVALEQAGPRARGGTVYVTLEPCAHTGATPPCAEAVVAAGVRRVVAAVRDPNPKVRGRGLRRLREAGVEVRTGVLREAARALIEPFGRWVTTGRPLVTLKLAATLDGKTAAPDGTSRWITGALAREDVHRLRSRVDAVAVGSGTAVADDPRLTVRLAGYDGPHPRRVLFDSSGRTPASAALFDRLAPTVVCTAEDADAGAWEDAGATVLRLPRAEGGVDLAAALDALAGQGICHLLVEGGPGLAGAFASQGLADRVLLYLAPKLVGGDAPGLIRQGVKTIADAWPLRIERVTRLGEDLRIEGRL